MTEQEPKPRTNGIIALVLCMVAVAVFVLYIAPALEAPLGLAPVARFIDERDINANMYFYTEVEQFSEANINMDNTMKYPPDGPQ